MIPRLRSPLPRRLLSPPPRRLPSMPRRLLSPLPRRLLSPLPHRLPRMPLTRLRQNVGGVAPEAAPLLPLARQCHCGWAMSAS